MEHEQKPLDLNVDEGRRKSGKARMANMTEEERKEFATRAARARWANVKDLRTISHFGEIVLFDGTVRLPCGVLEDGTRVLTQTGFLTAIGRHGTPKKAQGPAPFLEAENLAPFISDELRELSIPIALKMPNGGTAKGYRAELLPKVCEVYLQADDKGDVLLKSQESIVKECKILIRGLAHVGIIALVDEASGYEKDRERNALAKILEAFVAKELQPYVKTFPTEYYENLFRLRGLPFSRDSVKRPSYFGTLTNDIIYSRLAPGVLDELRKEIPRNEKGRPTTKMFRLLTANTGYPKLRELLGAAIAYMTVAEDYHSFHQMLDRFYPRQSGQLALVYNSGEDSGKGI